MQDLQGDQDQSSRIFLTKDGTAWKSVSLMLILLFYVIKDGNGNSDIIKYTCGPKNVILFHCLQDPNGLSGILLLSRDRNCSLFSCFSHF